MELPPYLANEKKSRDYLSSGGISLAVALIANTTVSILHSVSIFII